MVPHKQKIPSVFIGGCSLTVTLIFSGSGFIPSTGFPISDFSFRFQSLHRLRLQHTLTLAQFLVKQTNMTATEVYP